ncbi:hypothetical protein JCM10908_002851 [Rhodotorula pacifica]|uniref:SEC14 family lipid-binding protein n=1 Tax=Rhodotorula pacifica TaxID=1495444 RepID=UPI0031817CB6
MATSASLRARKDQIVEQYRDNLDLVRQVQKQAVDEIVNSLRSRRTGEPDEEDGGDSEEEEGGADTYDEDAIAATTALLGDTVTVFRFCRRARFSPAAALKLLHATCQWRLSSGLLQLTPASISYLYLSKPLLFFHPDLHDRFGRPCAILNLKHVQRTEDGKLDALKEYARFGWEVARRYLSDLSRKATTSAKDPTLQMVVIVDLDQAGMSNLEFELLPFFLDLLKNNFPGMVGAIFVLNYGWAYAGMWQLAKRVLPNTALERILFPSQAELFEFFDEDNLLVEHGGKIQYEYSPANPILQKYGQSQISLNGLPSPYGSRAPSRATSSSSLHHEVFHSAPGSGAGTPSLSRRQSGLVMTTRGESEAAASTAVPPPTTASWFSFGRGSRTRRLPPLTATTTNGLNGINGAHHGGETTPSGLRRVRSLAELQHRLEQTQREIDSEDSIDESGSDEGGTYTFDEEGSATGGAAAHGEGETSGYSTQASTVPSARSSRYSSRVGSRAVSREGSPNRYRRGIEPLTPAGAIGTEARALDLEILSPYNTSNPHFGYPAYVPPSSLDPSGTPRSRFPRRRKRDLVRTLTYLAALRFLALHRAIQYRLNVIVGLLLRLTGLGWWKRWREGRARVGAALGTGPGVLASETKDGSDKKVHWTSSTAGSTPSSSHDSSSSSLSSIAPPPPPSGRGAGAHDSHSPHHPSHHLHHQHLSSALVSSTPTSPTPLIDTDPSVLYLALLFIVIRTPDRKGKIKRVGRFLVVVVPTYAAAQARRLALRALVGKERADALLSAERVA